MFQLKKNSLPLVLILLFLSSLYGGVSTGLDLKSSINQAVHYLRHAQQDGRWMNHPGITALCLQAILNCHRKYNSKDGPWVRRPLEWLNSLQDESGAIYDVNSRIPTKNYVTALAILALNLTNETKYKETIKKAQEYLVSIQTDERKGYDPEQDYFYGGIGYGGDERPDINNLQLAIEALKESGFDKKHPVYQRALIFINRCQDSENNDQAWAKGSGGFAYSPNIESKKTDTVEIEPYGGATFAGLKSLIFCNVDQDDPRVQDAMRWVKRHFSVTEHPGMGQRSIYYYYYTMSKALTVLGIETLQLENGQNIDWKEELAAELLKRQLKDGSWVNQNRKYMEGYPLLATAYALNTLNLIYE